MQVKHYETLPESSIYAFTAEWWYSPASTRIDNYFISKDKSGNYWVLWNSWFDDNWFKDEEDVLAEIPVGEAPDIKSAAKLLIAKAWREEKGASSLDHPEFISQTGLLDVEDIEIIADGIWNEDGENN